MARESLRARVGELDDMR